MKKILSIFVLGFIFTQTVFAQYSTYYNQRKSLFEVLPITSDDIVFVGNSITDGAEWCELLGDNHVKNRGISGDITMGVYDRLNSITKGQPKKIFLMIGVNDISKGIPTDSIAANIVKIIKQIKNDTPLTNIFLQSVLPVNECFHMFKSHTKNYLKVKQLNNILAIKARELGITYIDLYETFTLPGTDKLNPQYSNDGLHLLGKGYMKWVEKIRPYIEQ